MPSTGCDLAPSPDYAPGSAAMRHKKLRRAGTRNEMQVPGDAKQPSTACTRLPSGSRASTKGTASAKPAIWHIRSV